MSWVTIGVSAGSMIAGGISSAIGQGKAAKSSRHSLQRSQKWQLDMYRRQLADARRYYEKYAFPNAGAIQAEQQGAYNQLGQAYRGLPSKVFSQSASRGFGPGSGLTMKSLGDVQGSYLQSLGQMMTNLAKFKNTPQWSFAMPGMPSAPNVPATPSGGGANYMADSFGTLGGMMLMKGMLNDGGSSGYNWFDSMQSGGLYGRNAPSFQGQGGGYGF